MATLKRRLRKNNGSGYDIVYFETLAELVKCSNGTTVESALSGKASANHRGQHFRNGSDPVYFPDIAFLGENPVTIENDTTQWWANAMSGYAWFTDSNRLNDQPSTWGFLINYAYGSDVFQIYKIQSGGDVYFRGGNAAGWDGTWIKMLQPRDIANKLNTIGGRIASGDQCIPPTKNFLLSVDHGIDNDDCCGLYVRTRWGNSTGTILELVRGWNGNSTGSYPCLIVNGAGQTIVQSANVSESGGSSLPAPTTVPMVRNIAGGTSEPTSLTHGEIYVVYE